MALLTYTECEVGGQKHPVRIYCFAVRKRLNDTVLHMKERVAGKIGNANNNAFKLRKLFAMYDTQKTGLVCFVALPFHLACSSLPVNHLRSNGPRVRSRILFIVFQSGLRCTDRRGRLQGGHRELWNAA